MPEQTEPPLDPDEIACPKCHAAPGDVCRTPAGRKARLIHADRWRAARADSEQTKPNKARKGRHTFTKAEASKAAKRAAANRRRRRAELDAAREAKREKVEAAKIEEEAERLAADAARYDRDRMLLRRKVLDVAVASWDAAEEAVKGIQRIKVDDEGRPLTTPIEYLDRNGDNRIRNVPDVRGSTPANDVKLTMTAAAIALDKLRAEEGEPTARIEHGGTVGTNPTGSEILGRSAFADLLEDARRLVDGTDTPP